MMEFAENNYYKYAMNAQVYNAKHEYDEDIMEGIEKIPKCNI